MRRAISLLMLLCMGCGTVSKQLFSSSKEVDAYRAFRVASQPGPRLARARAYLREYPHGAWSDEVNEIYVAEEAVHFAKAQQSYQDAINYLTDLPDGPHASEALASTSVYGQEAVDIETIELLSNARKADTLLEHESVQRHQVGEHIAAAIGALTSDGIFGKPLDETPVSLRKFMSGATTSWGKAPDRHVEKFRFLIPVARQASLERFATVRVTVASDAKGIFEGRIEGEDLFVRWAEADYARSLDPADGRARKIASDHARDVLGGAFEARLPAAECALPEQSILARRCRGWQAVAAMGDSAGTRDVILVRGSK